MGIGTDFSTNPSMVSGAIDPGVTPLEMAHAYETIATGGQPSAATWTRLPAQHDGHRPGTGGDRQDLRANGSTIAENHPKKIRVSPRASRQRGEEHSSREHPGRNRKLAQFAILEWGKTGTTENNGDAWFCGATTTSRPASG